MARSSDQVAHDFAHTGVPRVFFLVVVALVIVVLIYSMSLMKSVPKSLALGFSITLSLLACISALAKYYVASREHARPNPDAERGVRDTSGGEEGSEPSKIHPTMAPMEPRRTSPVASPVAEVSDARRGGRDRQAGMPHCRANHLARTAAQQNQAAPLPPQQHVDIADVRGRRRLSYSPITTETHNPPAQIDLVTTSQIPKPLQINRPVDLPADRQAEGPGWTPYRHGATGDTPTHLSRPHRQRHNNDTLNQRPRGPREQPDVVINYVVMPGQEWPLLAFLEENGLLLQSR